MSLNPNRFIAANVEPFWFEDSERHSVAMKEVSETIRLVGDEGQQFSGLYANRDFSKRPTIVKLGAWFNAANSPEQKYAVYQYAAANPESPIIYIDMPAHGYSDGPTANQRREIFRHKSISSVADSQATAVEPLLINSRELIVTGDSLGARAATDFAAKAGNIGLKPIIVTGYEMAGVDKRLSLGIAVGYFLGETVLQRRYNHGHHNQKLDNAYEKDFKLALSSNIAAENSFNALDVYKKDPTLFALIFARSPLASDSGFNAIENALDSNPDMTMALVSGGLSKISRWCKIESKVNELTAKYAERLNWQVWQEDSHSMNIAPQQPRFAAHSQAAIDLFAGHVS